MSRHFLLGLLLLGLVTSAQTAARPVPQEFSLSVGGLKRHVILHAPPGLASGCAVVFVLHGGGGQAADMAALTGMNGVADANGFLVVYPDGMNKNWNDGRGLESSADDVAFFATMIDALHKSFSTDSRRVYVAGISNGAIMAYKLAGDMAERIAAIAPVAGAISEPTAANYHPRAPVSVISICGVQDPLVHYGGGDLGTPQMHRGKLLSVPQSVAGWVAIDRCSPKPAEWDMPDKAGDGTRVHVQDWTGGLQGTEVELASVIGGGHCWPGGLQYLPETMIGRTSRNLQASEAIWWFFAHHPRQ